MGFAVTQVVEKIKKGSDRFIKIMSKEPWLTSVRSSGDFTNLVAVKTRREEE